MNREQLITIQDLREFEERLVRMLKELTGKPKVQKYLRSSEVCKRLGISSSTLQNLRISEKIPSSKLSGIFFYRMEDIEQLINDGFRKTNLKNGK